MQRRDGQKVKGGKDSENFLYKRDRIMRKRYGRTIAPAEMMMKR